MIEEFKKKTHWSDRPTFTSIKPVTSYEEGMGGYYIKCIIQRGSYVESKASIILRPIFLVAVIGLVLYLMMLHDKMPSWLAWFDFV